MTLPLLGYVDKLSGRSGDTLAFKVSSSASEPYQARLVRIVCADPNPQGPGLTEHEVESSVTGSYPSRVQRFFPGSYLDVQVGDGVALPTIFSVSATIWPTLPAQSNQCIASLTDATGQPLLSLYVGDDSRLYARLGTGTVVSTDRGLRARTWYHVFATVDVQHGVLVVGQQPVHGVVRDVTVSRVSPPAGHNIDTLGGIRIGAIHGMPASGHFNGKIEAPAISAGALDTTSLDKEPSSCIARWDFSVDTPTTRVHDVGPHGLHGELVNFPARAMTGSRWNGDEMCWRHAPAHYGAIHFHQDDIVDFNWDTDFSFTIPEGLPCGVYAVRLDCAGHSDAVPFFVCAPRGRPRAALCVLVSTFTYTVYGNHSRRGYEPGWRKRIDAWGAYPVNAAERPEYGLSTYNFHTDGSGICHASHRRPLFTMRPGYLTFCEDAGEGSGLRHFQADSHLIAWLEAKNIPYDIVTDQELHDEGVTAIAGYRALTTGSHPEYHTRETLDAITAYRDGGGNLLYLGGNGFYWKVALHQDSPGVIEIRRAESGIRAWAAEPGEYYQAFDGSYGGLWRRNGRPPQQLAGVGFSAQGTFLGSYYRRAAGASDPRTAWIFAGIDDETIGDFGLCGNGAAGFELDRVDSRLGTPDGTIVLASSEGHADTFVLVPEEQLTHQTTWSGDKPAEMIRADMVYIELPGGGKVFSTGSITFCGSLPWNDFDNNVSTLLGNVLERFLD